MSMVIVNNTAAQLTLNEMNRNNKRLGKSLKQVASGMKINGAGDGASEYAISERMKVQIRGLEQDTRNTQNGRSMLKVASGGVENIVEELRNLKEMALNAANDHNTDKDRQTLQKVYEQKCVNIEDIATSTNYNGKYLLNGNYDNFYKKMMSTIMSAESDVANDWWRNEIGAAMASGTTQATPPTGDVRAIPSGGSISQDGIYDLGSFSGTLQIRASAQNVKLVGNGTTNAVKIVANNGSLDLWLDNVNLTINENAPAINFNAPANTASATLHLSGKNSIKATGVAGMSIIQPSTGGLTIEGSGASLSIDDASTNHTGAVIGTRVGANCGNITIGNGVELNITATSSRAGIGTASSYGASSYSTCGDITIGCGAKVNVSVNSKSAAIGAGSGHGRCGTITIDGGATVTATSSGGAGIGSGEGGTCGDIVIYSGAKVTATSGGDSAGIGSGASISSSYEAKAGTVTIYSGANVTAVSKGEGADIGVGKESTGGSSTYGGTVLHDGATVNAGTITDSVTTADTEYVFGPEELTFPDPRSLIFQDGTQAGEAMKCYINNMRIGRLGLDNASLVPRENAVRAIEVIDAAITYSLDEATNLGAYISRLEYTESNLVTSSENTQAAESVIRDADMAKAMAEYTKNNVLLQASQSMLAQANQNSSSVLSLLQ